MYNRHKAQICLQLASAPLHLLSSMTSVPLMSSSAATRRRSIPQRRRYAPRLSPHSNQGQCTSARFDLFFFFFFFFFFLSILFLGVFFLFPAVELWVSCHFELKCCILDREDEDDVFCCSVVVVIILFLAFSCFFLLSCSRGCLSFCITMPHFRPRKRRRSVEQQIKVPELRDYSEGDMGYRCMWLSAYMGLESFSFFNHEICKQDAKLGDFSDG
jgi:hypothetical protein